MTASYANQEIWHVIVTSDDVKRMNVDQLDDAFRLDVVDASTLVWKNGMTGWQRLGAIAGLDADASDWEPERWPPQPARRAPQPARWPPQPARRAPQPAPPSAFATPLYAPPLYPPPRTRASVPSYVDFRRSPGSIRWGRWLFSLLLLTSIVLVAYRQNLLREGARRLGVETKYLYGERAVTTLVTAKASPNVKHVLTRLALLPGPNALPAPAKARAQQPALTRAAGPEPTERDVKTVSLDSLPVLTADEPAAAAPSPFMGAVIDRAAPLSAQSTAMPSKPKAAPVPAQARKASASEQRVKVDKREAPEPKAAPRPKPFTPVASDSPLKAAIRSAIAAEQAKK